jgi:hypothetical protein
MKKRAIIDTAKNKIITIGFNVNLFLSTIRKKNYFLDSQLAN